MDGLISQVVISPMKHFQGADGDIFHIMRKDFPGFIDFGEVYISTVKVGRIKGWKKHEKMTLNIVVPIGQMKFVLFDEVNNLFSEVYLSKDKYQRMTVPPGIWMGFQCMGEQESMLINFADIPHDPTEAAVLPLDNQLIRYQW